MTNLLFSSGVTLFSITARRGGAVGASSPVQAPAPARFYVEKGYCSYPTSDHQRQETPSSANDQDVMEVVTFTWEKCRAVTSGQPISRVTVRAWRHPWTRVSLWGACAWQLLAPFVHCLELQGKTLQTWLHLNEFTRTLFPVQSGQPKAFVQSVRRRLPLGFSLSH